MMQHMREEEVVVGRNIFEPVMNRFLQNGQWYILYVFSLSFNTGFEVSLIMDRLHAAHHSFLHVVHFFFSYLYLLYALVQIAHSMGIFSLDTTI